MRRRSRALLATAVVLAALSGCSEPQSDAIDFDSIRADAHALIDRLAVPPSDGPVRAVNLLDLSALAYWLNDGTTLGVQSGGAVLVFRQFRADGRRTKYYLIGLPETDDAVRHWFVRAPAVLSDTFEVRVILDTVAEQQ